MQKTVLIEMDKARNLRLGTNQLAMLQDLGVNLKNEEEMGFREIRAFFYVALAWEDKKLTLDRVGELMDDVIADKGMEYLTEKLQACVKNFFPQGKIK